MSIENDVAYIKLKRITKDIDYIKINLRNKKARNRVIKAQKFLLEAACFEDKCRFGRKNEK